MVVLVVEVALMLMPVLGATFFGVSIELIGLPVKPGLKMTRGSPKEAPAVAAPSSLLSPLLLTRAARRRLRLRAELRHHRVLD